MEQANGGILPMSKAVKKLTESLIGKYNEVIKFNPMKQFFSPSDSASESDPLLAPDVTQF